MLVRSTAFSSSMCFVSSGNGWTSISPTSCLLKILVSFIFFPIYSYPCSANTLHKFHRQVMRYFFLYRFYIPMSCVYQILHVVFLDHVTPTFQISLIDSNYKNYFMFSFYQTFLYCTRAPPIVCSRFFCRYIAFISFISILFFTFEEIFVPTLSYTEIYIV